MSISRKTGVLWSLLASVLSAFFIIPWKMATESGSISTVVFVLLLSAAIMNSLVLLLRSGRHVFVKPKRVEVLLSCGLAVVTLLGNFASAKAITYLTPASLNTFLRSEVIIVALLAMLFLKEYIDRKFYFGLLIVCVGFYVMTPAHTFGDDWSIGVGFALIAAVMFSGMSILVRKYVHQIDPVLVNGMRLWLSVGFWFLVNLRIPSVAEFNTNLVIFAVTASICGPVFARMCLMFSAVHIEARLTVLINMMSPVITLALSMIFLDELPDDLELLGGAIMLAGISFTLLTKNSINKQMLSKIFKFRKV